MLAFVELKKRENRDDIEFLQINGYVPCGFNSIWVYIFLPETSACALNTITLTPSNGVKSYRQVFYQCHFSV
jgi:hypothetical protein